MKVIPKLTWIDRPDIDWEKCVTLEVEGDECGGSVSQPLDAAPDDPWEWYGWCFLSMNQLDSGCSPTYGAAQQALVDCLFEAFDYKKE